MTFLPPEQHFLTDVSTQDGHLRLAESVWDLKATLSICSEKPHQAPDSNLWMVRRELYANINTGCVDGSLKSNGASEAIIYSNSTPSHYSQPELAV